jgi:hypothetical protein
MRQDVEHGRNNINFEEKLFDAVNDTMLDYKPGANSTVDESALDGSTICLVSDDRGEKQSSGYPVMRIPTVSNENGPIDLTGNRKSSE